MLDPGKPVVEVRNDFAKLLHLQEVAEKLVENANYVQPDYLVGGEPGAFEISCADYDALVDALDFLRAP